MEPRIRPLALALIRRGDEILVEGGRDDVKGETFFRLLGGGIDFGESGAGALRRELREELGSETDVQRLLGALESIFTYEGEPGHEIALVYECRLRDPQLYDRDEWEVSEPFAHGPLVHSLAWKRLASFTDGSEILYPDGAAELALTASASSR
jgi:ADP-ribose pyrophosphatase YjhB (NUDIX family)